MPDVMYRKADHTDIPAIASIRAAEWETEEFWTLRIKGYLEGKHHPQQALAPRIIFVAIEAGIVTGFIAGHLTRRFGYEGELQWINVVPGYRRMGIASALLQRLAGWFADNSALMVCVNVDPGNPAGKNFYTQHGAKELNEHWLAWNDISIVMKER